MGTDHGHRHDARADERRVRWALALTGAFMVAEVAGGLLSGSLALLADAGHMLTDTAALALSFAAFRVSRRPADPRRSYGYHRFQVMAAFLNGAALIAIVGWIAVEAVLRLREPQPVLGGLMLAVAVAGLAVNAVVLRILHGGDPSNLNLRGAALHVLGDLLGSVGVIAAALVILATGWTPVDPLLSLGVSLLIARSAWLLLRQSGHILMEGSPEHIDVEDLPAALVRAVEEVDEVHHVHAWSLTMDRPMVTLHAHVREGADEQAVMRAIHAHLAHNYGSVHATIQIERGRCLDD